MEKKHFVEILRNLNWGTAQAEAADRIDELEAALAGLIRRVIHAETHALPVRDDPSWDAALDALDDTKPSAQVALRLNRFDADAQVIGTTNVRLGPDQLSTLLNLAAKAVVEWRDPTNFERQADLDDLDAALVSAHVIAD